MPLLGLYSNAIAYHLNSRLFSSIFAIARDKRGSIEFLQIHPRRIIPIANTIIYERTEYLLGKTVSLGKSTWRSYIGHGIPWSAWLFANTLLFNWGFSVNLWPMNTSFLVICDFCLSRTVRLKSLTMFSGASILLHHYKSNLAHHLAFQNLVIEF